MKKIDKKPIEDALRQARENLANNANRPMSEASIEARACIECFEYVLRDCMKDDIPKPSNDITGFPEDSSNDHLRLALAIQVLVKELEVNKAYRENWVNGIATSVLSQYVTNGIEINEAQWKTATGAANAFVDNITHAAKFPLGWVYNNK